MLRLLSIFLALTALSAGPDAPTNTGGWGLVENMGDALPGTGWGLVQGGDALTFQLFESTDVGAAACRALNGAGGIDEAYMGKGSTTPTVKTRSTGAYARIYDGTSIHLQWVGVDELRCERLTDGSGTYTGYMPEPQATNKCLQSQDFTTTWNGTVGNLGATADKATAPDGSDTADALTENSGTGSHYIRQTVTLTAAVYTWSAYIKAGVQPYVIMRSITVGLSSVWFKLSDCTMGTEMAAGEGHVEDLGNGWCRVSTTFTGTAASHSMAIYAAEADNDYFYNGTPDAVALTAWGAQIELGSYPTSYIPTAAATVTRTADQLRYVAGDNIGGGDRGQGTIVATVLCPDYNIVSDGYILQLHGTNTVFLISKSSSQYPSAFSTSSGSSGYSYYGQDLSTGIAKEITVTWEIDALSVYQFGAIGYSDTDVGSPLGLSSMYIGSKYNGSDQPGCLISNIHIYKKAVAP